MINPVSGYKGQETEEGREKYADKGKLQCELVLVTHRLWNSSWRPSF